MTLPEKKWMTRIDAVYMYTYLKPKKVCNLLDKIDGLQKHSKFERKHGFNCSFMIDKKSLCE